MTARTTWKSTLPQAHGTNPGQHAALALIQLGKAVAYQPDDRLEMLDMAGCAAAEIRAWRNSLPEDRGGRDVKASEAWMSTLDDRALLRYAVSRVLNADRFSDSPSTVASHLRSAEGVLRVLWKRYAPWKRAWCPSRHGPHECRACRITWSN